MKKKTKREALEKLKKGPKMLRKEDAGAYYRALAGKKKLPTFEGKKEYKPVSARAKAYQSLKTPEEYEKFLKDEEEDEGHQNFIKHI